MSAFSLSLAVALVSTTLAALFGVPLGWWLARGQDRRRRVLDAALFAPLVLPPTVLGYVLLVSIGRHSVVGGWFEALTGAPLVFSRTALIVAALVTTLPLVVMSARDGFLAIDEHLRRVAASLGASPLETFWRVELGLARPSLVSGLTLAFAKALGDFGVTLMIAGNLPGETQTASLALYEALMMSEHDAALQLGGALALTAFAVTWLARTRVQVSHAS